MQQLAPAAAPRVPLPSAQRLARAELQRSCDCEQEREEPPTPGVLRKSARLGGAGSGGVAPKIVQDVLGREGCPLPAEQQTFFEQRFGQDLSQIRVHTDTRAAESARAVHALAYTVGPQIVFGEGQYQPGSPGGLRLLAHELSHTLQQRAVPASLSRSSELKIGDASDELERDADRMADAALTGAALPAAPLSPSNTLQRVSSAGCPPHPSGIGDTPSPESCTASTATVAGALFEYCEDSSQPKPAEVPRFSDPTLLADLRGRLSVEVHGFATPDGPAGRAVPYNLELSCHRAADAKARLVSAGISSSVIRLFKHGGTTSLGAPDLNRSVIISTAPEPRTPRHFRVAAASFLSCATCNPFSDDLFAGPSPPVTESTILSKRQLHAGELSFTTRDSRTVDPGSIVSSGAALPGTSGYCGTHRTAAVLRATRSAPTTLRTGPIEAVELESDMETRVEAMLPANLPLAPCGLSGHNPRIPAISSRFKMRLFADGTRESEFHAATPFPFHYLYEDGALKFSAGAPVRPPLDYAAWATSGAGSPPLALALEGLKALTLACTTPLAFSLCPTACAGLTSTPTSANPYTMIPGCAAVAATVHSVPCPTLCSLISAPTNRSPSGGI